MKHSQICPKQPRQFTNPIQWFQSGPLTRTRSALKIKPHHCHKILRSPYSVEITELNWRCGLSSAVSLCNVWKKRNLKRLRSLDEYCSHFSVLSRRVCHCCLAVLVACHRVCVYKAVKHDHLIFCSLREQRKWLAQFPGTSCCVALWWCGERWKRWNVSHIQQTRLELRIPAWQYLQWQQWILVNTLTPPT